MKKVIIGLVGIALSFAGLGCQCSLCDEESGFKYELQEALTKSKYQSLNEDGKYDKISSTTAPKDAD